VKKANYSSLTGKKKARG